MVGYDTSTENSPNHALGSFGVKAPFGDSNCGASISKHDQTVIAARSQSRSAHAPGLEAPFTIPELAPLFAEPGSTTLPEPEANPAALDHEESEEESDDDLDDDDDDADIPCFSDIEAMILEMDLCPLDQDSYISSEVLEYQNEDSKRNIIRFEQCARSSMQRTLASKGALAVLYGNHIKKYIKKTEVIIGRSTEDNEVDIDLGKEGLHNKISRRQALIKMEGDGSFSLKNLGKSSIYLNGEEVATGQLVSLGSSNLIEIREMYFNFETNHKSVRQYLGRIGQKSEDKYTKLERSPEGGP
ncbi:microspherule protein 1 isoform X2 [Pyrus x bretschneideri]|uniref:microspherule protein 1 isoform X2 n=1 Tax=Pyrus x bretschneideri TaxID=225117 RepID=UPI0020303F54|nr:microspherule protein 1 isoform X2 [Pyrus x bretschneideri]